MVLHCFLANLFLSTVIFSDNAKHMKYIQNYDTQKYILFKEIIEISNFHGGGDTKLYNPVFLKKKCTMKLISELKLCKFEVGKRWNRLFNVMNCNIAWLEFFRINVICNHSIFAGELWDSAPFFRSSSECEWFSGSFLKNVGNSKRHAHRFKVRTRTALLGA